MGIGDGLIPDNLNINIYSHIDIVSDEEALNTSKRLIREEGILCDISSGTNVCAAIRLAKKLGLGKTVVTVLPDTGERYFSTELFDEISEAYYSGRCVSDEILVYADDEALAELYASAFNAALERYEYGLAVLKLTFDETFAYTDVLEVNRHSFKA